MGKKEEEATVIIGIILILAVAITVSKVLFPYFVLGTCISFVLLTISGIFYFKDDYGDATWITIFGIAFGLCFLGMLVTYGIGYGFGESDLGHAVTDVSNAFNLANKVQEDAENMAIEAVQNATNEIIQNMNMSEVYD